MPECYIRGSTIKYLRIPDEIIDMVKEEVASKGRGRGGTQQNKQQGKGRGGAGRGVWKCSLPQWRLFVSCSHNMDIGRVCLFLNFSAHIKFTHSLESYENIKN